MGHGSRGDLVAEVQALRKSPDLTALADQYMDDPDREETPLQRAQQPFQAGPSYPSVIRSSAGSCFLVVIRASSDSIKR